MSCNVKLSTSTGHFKSGLSTLSYLLRRLRHKPHVQQDLCTLIKHEPYVRKLARFETTEPARGQLLVSIRNNSDEFWRLERACMEENLTPLLIEEGLLEAQEESICVPAGTEVKVGHLKFVLEADAVVRGYARNLKSLDPEMNVAVVETKSRSQQES